MTSLFRSLRFYVAATLSADEREELERLIEQNGGVVSDTPKGATQLVDYDKLDAHRLELIATDFIKESVAFRALQDPVKYTGEIFTMKPERRHTKKRGKLPYTQEDDARMLHFAHMRDWKCHESIPTSAWGLAENARVTLHSTLSMHEHFRKQLQHKKPIEQRIIMAKAAATARARWLGLEAEDEADEEEKQVVDPPSKVQARPSSTGFTDAATPKVTMSTQSRQNATIPESKTIESRLKEVEEEKFSVGRTRSRKPMSPLRISQRVQRSKETESSGPSADEDITSLVPTPVSQTSSVPSTQSNPATSAARSTSAASPATPSTPGDQSTGKAHQKRKRSTSSSGVTVSQETESDAESEADKSTRGNRIFFRSVWTDVTRDQSKRRMLQRFFEPPLTPAPQPQASSTESVVSTQNEDDTSTEADSSENQATDEETDGIICQLQIDTHQDMPSVVHALYYCSGDVEMARAFLKGASPSGMWSPQDDLLLVNLVAKEGTNYSAIDVAVAHGDFASMQVARDARAILKRVEFLR